MPSHVYTPIATKALQDTVDAAEWNASIKDNMNASPAGIVAAKGYIFPSDGAYSYQEQAPGVNNQIVESDTAETLKMKNSWAFVPVGGIILWSGLLASLPANWQICNGTNGTPNLRDRFVIGAGGAYAVGATGGAATINIQHSHTSTTASSGAHTHTQADTGAGASHSHSLTLGAASAGSDVDAGLNLANQSHSHTTTVASDAAHIHNNPDTASDGAHTHIATTDNKLSTTQSILPPYYALAYIMRLS